MKPLLGGLNGVFLGLALFVAPLFFFTDFSKNPYSVQSFILTCSCAVLFIIWAFEVLSQKAIYFKTSKVDLFFAGFVIAALLSVYFNYMEGPRPAAVLGEFIRKGSLLLTNALAAYLLARRASAEKPLNLIWLAPLWGLCWLLCPAFKTAGYFDFYAIILWLAALYFCFVYFKNLSFKAFLNIFIAVGFLACCYGIMQHLGRDLFWEKQALKAFGDRAVSTFGNPNFLASYAVMVLPLSFVFCLSEQKIYNKIFYFLACFVYAAFLAVSMTRSSWLGAAAAFTVLLLCPPFWKEVFKNKLLSFLLVAAMACVFFLWPAKSGGEYKSAVSQRAAEVSFSAGADRFSLNIKAKDINPSYHQRLMMWKCALDAFKKAPWTGAGWGAFQLNYAFCQGDFIKQNPDLKILMTQANGAHNIIFETMAQSGLLGLFFFIFFVLGLTVAGILKIKQSAEGDKLLPAALLAACLGMLADNLLNITAQINITSFVFWWLASSLAVYGQKPKKHTVSFAAAFLIAAAVIVLAIPVFKWQINNLKADRYEHSALKLLAAGNTDAAIGDLKKSLRYKKYNAEAWDVLINLLIKRRNINAALSAADNALELYPNYYEFYFKRGVLLSGLNEQEKALPDFRSALALRPNYIPVLIFTASYFAEKPQNATDEDLATFTKAAADMPYLPDLQFVAAKINYARENTLKARELAGDLAEREAVNDDYFEFLLKINEDLGITYDSVIEKGRSLRTARNIMIFTKNPSENQIIKIASLYPGDVSAAVVLGEFYFKNGRYEKAIEVLSKVYEGNENNFGLNFAFASAYSSLGDSVKAAAYLNKILSLDEYNQTAQSRLTALKYK